jgi:hypothetical protein
MSMSIVEWAGIDARDKIGVRVAADAIGIDFDHTRVHLDWYHRLPGLLAVDRGPLVRVVTIIRTAAAVRGCRQRGGSQCQNMRTWLANAEKSLTLQTTQFNIHPGPSASHL